MRRQLADDPTGVVRVNIIDHLVERLRQAQAGEITLPFAPPSPSSPGSPPHWSGSSPPTASTRASSTPNWRTWPTAA
jgi:hypothetical protein